MKNSKDVLVLSTTGKGPNRATQKILESAGYEVHSETHPSLSPHLVLVEAMTVQEATAALQLQLSSEAAAKVPVLILAAQIAQNTDPAGIQVLPNTADSRTLLQRVKQLIRTQEALSHTFTAETRPKARLRTYGRLLLAHESKFIIDSPVKLAPYEPVELTGTLIELAGLEGGVFRRTQHTARMRANGFYVSEVVPFGLDAQLAARLRSFFKETL